MNAPFRSRMATGPAAQVVLWTIVNVALAILFTGLLLVDDRTARAAGF